MFEEPDRQKLYETISFEELYKEIIELRVLHFLSVNLFLMFAMRYVFLMWGDLFADSDD